MILILVFLYFLVDVISELASGVSPSGDVIDSALLCRTKSSSLGGSDDI